MLKHARSSEGWNDKNIGQKGFTLIELLVVIIILGILAAVVVLAVNGLQDQGEGNACNTERKAVETAAAAFFADNDAFPASSEELDPEYLRDPAYQWGIDADGVVTSVNELDGNNPPSDEACGLT